MAPKLKSKNYKLFRNFGIFYRNQSNNGFRWSISVSKYWKRRKRGKMNFHNIFSWIFTFLHIFGVFIIFPHSSEPLLPSKISLLHILIFVISEMKCKNLLFFRIFLKKVDIIERPSKNFILNHCLFRHFFSFERESWVQAPGHIWIEPNLRFKPFDQTF